MNQRTILITGFMMAALGVALGAFGAHGLKDVLMKTGRQETFELAVRYQFYHAFGLMITGLLHQQLAPGKLRLAAWSFTLGILFFSGSLYVLSLTGITILGAVTPVGGILFLTGWLLLLSAAIKK